VLQSRIPEPPRSSQARGIGASVAVSAATVDRLIDSTADLPNRFYRYPAARALLPLVGHIRWITPNNVTYTHIVVGLAAASIVAFTAKGPGEKYWFLLAFLLLEVRMILDCFDGVLARARKTSSPFGRALDELADSIAFIAVTWAMTHRMQLGFKGFALACLTLIFGGLSANAWDFYKRKLTSALREGRDGVLEEIQSKKALIESGKGSFLDYWGVYFDCFQVLLYEVRPAKGDSASFIRANAEMPSMRRFAKLLAFLSFDNGLGILNVGVLIGAFLGSEVFILAYAATMWLTVMVVARVVLRGKSAT